MDYFLGKLYMGLFWLRWCIALSAARGARQAYADRKMEESPFFHLVMNRVFQLELIGVSHGWLKEDQRTITAPHFGGTDDNPGETPSRERPN